MSKIDWTKPVRIIGQTHAEVAQRVYVGASAVSDLRMFTKKPRYAGNYMCFRGNYYMIDTGERAFDDKAPGLENVNPTVVGEVDWSKPLCLRGSPHVTVTLEGTMLDGRKVVKLGFLGSKEIRTVYGDGRVFKSPTMVSGDDVVNKVEPIKKTYRNIYADGTIGSSVHHTFDDCAARSKYGKTRVGMLITEKRGDVIVNSRVHSTLPLLRTRGNPSGINPFA